MRLPQSHLGGRRKQSWRTEGEKLEGRGHRSTWPGENVSGRDFLAGEESSVEEYLLNMGVQFINI